MKVKTILSSLILLFIAGYLFVSTPNINPLFAEGAFFWLIVLSTFAILFLLIPNSIKEITDIDSKKLFSKIKKRKLTKYIFAFLAICWIAYFVVNILFSPLFFYKDYRDQMAQPKEEVFAADIQAIDMNQIPIVDKDLARTLADKKLGESPSLGSQVVLGEPTIQNVDGELVWVVPLHHSGFFKWLSNLDGSAGYIKVSATNLKNIKYVSDYKIKYQPEAFFFDDLTRKIRFSGNFFEGITDYSFEIDDEGNPFWVISTYKNLLGFGLPEANGIVLLNAQTGETSKHNMDEIPEWVDRVQPEEYIIEQINNKGSYVHGVFNFSNKDKYKTTAGHSIIYFNNRCYLFTGLSSVGIDESATGFIMVDMVTKEPVIYRMSGATERSAMDSAQGKVQDLGYRATFPIILNIEGQPTYFMTLKDSAGLIKKYAFVSVQDYMVVGVGDTIALARSDYNRSLENMGTNPNIQDTNKAVTKQGTINRISSSVVESNSVYTFTLKENPEVIYICTASVNNSIVLTKPGDTVIFDYIESDLSIKNVKIFSNESYQIIDEIKDTTNEDTSN